MHKRLHNSGVLFSLVPPPDCRYHTARRSALRLRISVGFCTIVARFCDKCQRRATPPVRARTRHAAHALTVGTGTLCEARNIFSVRAICTTSVHMPALLQSGGAVWPSTRCPSAISRPRGGRRMAVTRSALAIVLGGMLAASPLAAQNRSVLARTPQPAIAPSSGAGPVAQW